MVGVPMLPLPRILVSDWIPASVIRLLTRAVPPSKLGETMTYGLAPTPILLPYQQCITNAPNSVVLTAAPAMSSIFRDTISILVILLLASLGWVVVWIIWKLIWLLFSQ